jgi:aldehyde dehydrogenase (NAD+)
METNIKSYPNLIDGTWKTLSATPLEDRNPADYNEIIGLFPMATLDDTKSAIQAAHSALPVWSRTPAPARGAILDKASQILTSRLDHIAIALTREEGKTLAEAKGEVTRARDIFKYYAGEGWRYSGQVLQAPF